MRWGVNGQSVGLAHAADMPRTYTRLVGMCSFLYSLICRGRGLFYAAVHSLAFRCLQAAVVCEHCTYRRVPVVDFSR
jgi:hypothetical protein